jgi:hypothetical protein
MTNRLDQDKAQATLPPLWLLRDSKRRRWHLGLWLGRLPVRLAQGPHRTVRHARTLLGVLSGMDAPELHRFILAGGVRRFVSEV